MTNICIFFPVFLFLSFFSPLPLLSSSYALHLNLPSPFTILFLLLSTIFYSPLSSTLLFFTLHFFYSPFSSISPFLYSSLSSTLPFLYSFLPSTLSFSYPIYSVFLPLLSWISPSFLSASFPTLPPSFSPSISLSIRYTSPSNLSYHPFLRLISSPSLQFLGERTAKVL